MKAKCKNLSNKIKSQNVKLYQKQETDLEINMNTVNIKIKYVTKHPFLLLIERITVMESNNKASKASN